MIKLVGYAESAFVRKLRIALAVKGLGYELDPLNPFCEMPRLLALNPAGNVPVLVLGGEILTDQIEIIDRLELDYPEPSLYPAEPGQAERASYLHEWSDACLAPMFAARLFFQRVARPRYFGTSGDPGDTGQSLEEGVGVTLEQLDALVGEEDYLCGGFSIADIAVVSSLRAGLLCGVRVEPDRYDALAAYLRRAYAHPAVRQTFDSEAQTAVLRDASRRFGADPFAT